ncbi:MAG: beta-ketoacyl-[acyl-carrier-protein] synthase family protein [Thermoguttaceae bacterium]
MSSTPRRIVITGLGIISPLGSTKQSLWDGLTQGRSGVQRLAEPLPVRIGSPCRQFTGEIDNFGELDKETKKTIRKGLKVMCRECQMGVAAAQWALNDAALKSSSIAPERIGISFGADYMLSLPEEFTEGIVRCVDDQGQFQFSRWGGEGMTKMSPLWLLKYLPNMPASHLAIYNDFRGPNNSLTLREAAANLALGEAFQIILRDDADAMLVGATGTRLHTMKTIHAVQQEEVCTDHDDPASASRPFDLHRNGMVLGEGAAAIVLEEMSSAQARGAAIYGEVLASASSAVAGPRLVADRRRAMQNVLESVLRSSSLKPDEIGHLHAHGLSTRTCDVDESQAIGDVFGRRATPLPVVSSKGHLGNLGAGSGLLELIGSLLALQHRRLFPTLNYTTPDPACPVSVVRDGEVSPGGNFVNLSVTPQGQASAVLVRQVG